MNKIKVLLVDDSAVIRKVLGDLLSSDPLIEVVGTAANGKIALEQLERLKPDIVTLDIEMPEMNGLETVERIRQKDKKIPIIMCSSLTSDGATHTLNALSLGASDYVTKPSSHGANTRDVVGDDLVRKIKGLVNANCSSAIASPLMESRLSCSATLKCQVNASSPDVIAIGVSTGGPNALAELIPLLPRDLKSPVLIVQHMPPVFTKLLAERLNDHSPLPVFEAQHAQEVKPGHIYLAPGGMHMEIKKVLGRVLIQLNENPPENSCRPAVDVLFRSVARVYRSQTLAIVLTGMGQDGLKGCREIKAAGGEILIQDRESSAVWGMPGAIYEAGLNPSIFTLPQIAARCLGSARNN